LAARISIPAIRRFATGDGDLVLATAGKIADALGLRAGTAKDGDGGDASLAGRLRDAIRADGRSVNAIASAAGVASAAAYLFASGKMGLTLANAGKLAGAVGLAFGPAGPVARVGPDRSLASQLRDAIRADGRSANAIALEAGILPRVVRKFAIGERDLVLAHADRIADVLKLRAWTGEGDASLGRRLREAIRADGRSVNAIAWAAGLASGSVGRFASGEQDLTLATAGKLADALGLMFGPAGDVETLSRAQASTRVRIGRPLPSSWRGTREELERDLAAIGSHAARDVVRKLIELTLMPDHERPTKRKLEMESDRGDAVNHLVRLADSGSRLGKAIGFPGKGASGYWIEIEITPARNP
jgi:transcriptional regulator with XRE-family HTH domain